MLDRLKRHHEKTERPSIDSIVSERGTCVRIQDLQPRELVELIGEVTHVCTIRQEFSQGFEIEISDGSHSIVAFWSGRPSIAGIERGRRLAIWGRAAPAKRDDSLVVYNPRYELLER